MKKIVYITLLLAFTFTHAQNDIKARVEFEEAETAFAAEDYEKALVHLTETEKLIGKWTPVVSFMKIETLFALTDTSSFGHPKMQPLYEEVTKYMTYLNKLNADDVPMEKYKVVYAIEKIFTSLKFSERQSVEFLKAKKEHDAENYGVAITLYEKLAQKGNSWAMRNIGLLYRYGLGRDKDLEKAKEFYIKAFNNGNMESAIDIASIYLEEKNLNEAKKWRLKSAEMGHLGSIYYAGYYEYHNKNYEQALTYFLKATSLGSASAFVGAGDIYYYGGLPKDYKKALEYYKKAVSKGNPTAMTNTGRVYHNGGNGIVQNYQTAMEWYLKAEQRGELNAMKNIGWIYEKGQGSYAKDYKKAEQWYQKAADKNKLYSSYLGDLYSISENKQPQKALENYEIAAVNGGPEGKLASANYYYSGKVVPKDYAKAIKYYEEYYQSEKKNEAYIDNIIDMYNRGGNGLEKNKEKVKYWREIRRK